MNKIAAFARTLFASRAAQIAVAVIALVSAAYGWHRRVVAAEVSRVVAVAQLDSARAVALTADSVARADSLRWAAKLAKADSTARVSAGRAIVATRGWQRLRDSLRAAGADTGAVGDVAAAADTAIGVCSLALTDCQIARVAADSARAVAEARAARVTAERDSALRVAREHAQGLPQQPPVLKRRSFWQGVGAGALAVLAVIVGAR